MLTFKSIPYQIKINDGGEHRQELPKRFTDAISEATLDGDNIILMRRWEDYGVRFGEPEDIFDELSEEIEALYDAERIHRLVEEAQTKTTPKPKEYFKISPVAFESRENWKDRLWLLDHMENPDQDDYEVLNLALHDEKMQVRREAVSLLAMIEEKETLPYLRIGLRDKSVPVKRTAGDAYSDLGFAEGLPDMYEALDDKSSIVRWRAAMFIYEAGNEDSLPYLRAHQDDPQYDVRLQIEMAIARIEHGEEALGSVWKQIQERER
ncbi:virulence factor [Salinicoccus albus]|uniref:virulence factor n=1 Tax=Salinicoccus albus TaxID=418756 RepID=UPI00039C377B